MASDFPAFQLHRIKLRLIRPDNGNCRVYYRAESSGRLFAFQEEGRGAFKFYACSKDGEPSHSMPFESVDIDRLPDNDDITSRAFCLFWRQSRPSHE